MDIMAEAYKSKIIEEIEGMDCPVCIPGVLELKEDYLYCDFCGFTFEITIKSMGFED